MANFGIYLLIAIFLLSVPLNVLAQRASLSVTGTTTDVRVQPPLMRVPIENGKPWTGMKFERQGQMEPWFAVTVRLQICNKDDIAVIVPTIPTLRMGTTNINFLELPSSDSKVVATAVPYSRNSPSKYDWMPSFLKELEKPEPSRSMFSVIEPGTCYDTADSISIKSGYKIVILPGQDENKPPVEIAVPEYSQFKIQYSLPLKDSLPVSEATRRWSKIGKLLTASDGDFFLETDFIINKPHD